MTRGDFRRVVTGHDPSGRGTVITDGPSDDVVTIGAAGVTIADMWKLSSVPTDTERWERWAPDAPMPIAPEPGGLNFRMLRFDPSSADAAMDGGSVLTDMGSPDAHVEGARHPAMHRTATVDFGIVVSGSITLLLDDQDVHLFPGDVVVQRGTSHAWENRGDEPCLIAFVVVDAEGAA